MKSENQWGVDSRIINPDYAGGDEAEKVDRTVRLSLLDGIKEKISRQFSGRRHLNRRGERVDEEGKIQPSPLSE